MADPVSPWWWVAGGGGGTALLMTVARIALKQFSEIGVDRNRSTGEITIHQGYMTLIKNLEHEIDRVKRIVDDCERRHEERDVRDDKRDAEFRELNNKLREKGLL